MITTSKLNKWSFWCWQFLFSMVGYFFTMYVCTYTISLNWFPLRCIACNQKCSCITIYSTALDLMTIIPDAWSIYMMSPPRDTSWTYDLLNITITCPMETKFYHCDKTLVPILARHNLSIPWRRLTSISNYQYHGKL